MNYITVTTLTFIYVDSKAASLVMTPLLMLITIPLTKKTLLSIDVDDATKNALEESYHVICYCWYTYCNCYAFQVMLESITHIQTVKSFSLQKPLVEILTGYLVSTSR